MFGIEVLWVGKLRNLSMILNPPHLPLLSFIIYCFEFWSWKNIITYLWAYGWLHKCHLLGMIVSIIMPLDLMWLICIALLLNNLLGTLLLNAQLNRCAGIVENLATWRTTVQMRAFAIPVAKLDIGPESALLLHCLQGTWGCVIIAISRGTLL